MTLVDHDLHRWHDDGGPPLPESEPGSMGDQIFGANVIRVWRNGKDGDPRAWIARIGPDDGRGIEARAPTAAAALVMLACRVIRLRWSFDAGWQPR
jgi:hypothetical protein